MSNLVDQIVSDVYTFFCEHGNGLIDDRDHNEFIQQLRDHVKYGTLFIMKDENGISAVCRYNVVDENTFHAIDVAIRSDLRRIVALKELITQGVIHHPHGHNLTHFVFEREGKYPDRKQRRYSLHECLKRRK